MIVLGDSWRFINGEVDFPRFGKNLISFIEKNYQQSKLLKHTQSLQNSRTELSKPLLTELNASFTDGPQEYVS
jgi:hypothetical protein